MSLTLYSIEDPLGEGQNKLRASVKYGFLNLKDATVLSNSIARVIDTIKSF